MPNLRNFALTLLLTTTSTAVAEPLSVFKDCDVCPEMVELPLGEFTMGPLTSELYSWANEESELTVLSLPRTVLLNIKIAVARNEITVEEYMACVDDGACNATNDMIPAGAGEDVILTGLSDPRFDQIPFEEVIAQAERRGRWIMARGLMPKSHVSFHDAQDYVRWLNRKLGSTAYRLPTEAEWEYAARAGRQFPYSQGNDPTSNEINVSGLQTERLRGEPQPQLRTLGFPVPVNEMKAANDWGLQHMSGNISEITMSCLVEGPELPHIWQSLDEWLKAAMQPSCIRILRGGSYVEPLDLAQVTSRQIVFEDSRSSHVGFRVLKELE